MVVDLRNGSPSVSEVEHMYFTRKLVAKRALRQARRGLEQVECSRNQVPGFRPR
jgi:hypothetical protein